MADDGIQVVEAPEVERALRERASGPLPAALPVLPLKDAVAYPDTLTPLAVGQARSMKLIDDVLGGERTLVLVASRDPELDEPGPEQLYDVGVVGVVARMLKIPDGTMRILVQATDRVRLEDYIAEQPYLVARIEALPDDVEDSPELEALTRNVQRTFSEIIEQIPYLPEELQLAVTNIEDPSALAHLIAGSLRISTEEKQELLEEVDVTRRLRRLSEILARELEVIQLGSRIQSEVESEMEKGQREYYLREQLKAIQRELGEEDETQAEVNELRERIEAAKLPEDARKAADRELSRLEKLPSAAAEYGVIRTYLEWLVELPWSARDRPTTSTSRTPARCSTPTTTTSRRSRTGSSSTSPSARLNPDSHGPILCFVGPPGVGKTSLGALDRPRPGPRVRADLGRRGPRRGGDPRPPAHLRRRDARDDHPRASRRRLAQPGVHDRRDRQDGRRLSGRPVERDARGPRSRRRTTPSATTTSTCRSTSPR